MALRKKILIGISLSILLVAVLIVLPEKSNKIKTSHFTFIFSNGIDTAKIIDLSNALESNYSRISNELKTIPAENIETHIYAQRWRYIKATKNWFASGSIEGISKLHFVQKAWDESDAKKIAVHEFTHTVVLKLLLNIELQPFNLKDFDQKFASFPTWLWEAISVYEAAQFVDPKSLPYLNNGRYPNISELNGRSKGGKIYACGYTMIEYILSSYGEDKLVELIKNYGDLKKTFNITDEAFCKDWYNFVKDKYLG